MKPRIVIAGLAVIAAVGFSGYHAYRYSLGLYATTPVYQTGRGAIDGHDPVAFFTTGAPVAGRPELTLEWNGATWRFADERNRAAFRAAPERYAPQFGGYCAYAVANAYTARSSPDAWHIEDGRLYLNFDASVRERWRERKAEYIAAATRNWPAVIQD